jgi:hypothetical protein
MPALVDAQIAAQARLRAASAAAIAAAWTALPSYNESDVSAFLASAVPITTAAQQASIQLTNAYLARSLGVRPVAIDTGKILEQVRNGTTPAEVYRRPFVTVWSALKDSTDYQQAVADGLHRATSAVETDVQLAMRQTLVAVAEQHTTILGYRRVPDPGACAFCVLVSGQRYLTDQLMPIHPHCGCGVDVITTENRGDFTGKASNDLQIPAVTRDGVTAAVEHHGELGPLLVDGSQNFTRL